MDLFFKNNDESKTTDHSRDNTVPLNIDVVSNVSTSLVFFRDLPMRKARVGIDTNKLQKYET